MKQCPYVAEAVQELRSKGYKVGMVNTTLKGSPLGLHGCASHPTVADHQEMASLITPAIEAAVGW